MNETASARNSDPESSHEAAKDYEAIGDGQRHRKRAYDAVVEHPGRTARELAYYYSMNRDLVAIIKLYEQLHRRLPELRAREYIRNGKARRCLISRKLSQTWWPA